MKVLQVNNVYGEKSTGILTKLLHEELLASGVDAMVVYGRGKGEKAPHVVRLCPDWYGKVNSLCSRITGLPYGGCLLSTWRLQRIIRRERPDVVHLQCINGNFVNIYRLVAWLNNQRIKTVFSLHGAFLYTGNCGQPYGCEKWKICCGQCGNLREATRSWALDRTAVSWKKMQRAFAGFEKDGVLCPVSEWVAQQTKMSGIVCEMPVKTVYNAVDAAFCWESGLKKENVVLHVTAHFSPNREHPKGGWYVLELAKRFPQTQFYVAGPAEFVTECPKNVTLLGEVTDRQMLANWYRQAKVTLVTSRAETFSMPCAESLCCGTPVVGFCAGGPEEISLPDYSEFVPFGDMNGLSQTLRRWLDKDVDGLAMAIRAKEAYSPEKMAGHFLEIYREALWK